MKTGRPSSAGMAHVIRRTCAYYWPSHVLTVLAVAVCAAVVAGALIVGDSVRGTLRAAADQRLGNVSFAWFTGDRVFREALAGDVQGRLPAGGLATASLSLAGVASSHDGQRRTGGVRVIGVQDSFSRMIPGGRPAVTGGTVAVSRRLADVLSLHVGDEIVLRVERPDVLREMALKASGRSTAACRMTVSRIAGDGELGRFGLENTQVPPLNVFVDLAFLQKLAGVDGKANLLLLAGVEDMAVAESALREAWDFADGGLEWRTAGRPEGGELRSRDVFLSDNIARAAGMVSTQSAGVLTYLVNSMTAGRRTTPYAFVSGVEAMPGGERIGSGEIVVTDWLADDLGIRAGDTLELRSYVMGSLRALVETSTPFRVQSVVPLAEAADPSLMPAIPGLSDAGSCAEWSTGIPVDFSKVRAKDEAYWDKWRGAPKAFVGLADARRLWGSRWGGLTAMRYPGGEAERNGIRERLRALLAGGVARPALRPVREEAARAGSEALDFGQLFLGLSLFLMVSAVVLMTLLFGLAGEQRMEQTGILMALGFDSALLRRWAMSESMVTALAGGLLGCLGGVGYAKGLLGMLQRGWSGEAPLAVRLSVSWLSPAVAIGIACVLAILISGGVARRLMRMPARNLMDEVIDESGVCRRRRAGWIWTGVGVLALLTAAFTSWTAMGTGHEGRVEAFFVLGACLLVAGFSAMRRLIAVWGIGVAKPPAGRLALARRNAGRHVRRSLLVAGLTACAIFLLVAVALFEPEQDASRGRSAGTGGYGLMVRTSAPITGDLNLERERQRRGLDGAVFKGVAFTGVRVTEGDDAGCGNLNRAQRPRLAGVDPMEFARRDAFRFITSPGGECTGTSPWMLLAKDWGKDVVPAVADEATLMWGLEKKAGDELVYKDENGQAFRLRFVGMIANSVLQGNVIVPEGALSRRFPSGAPVRLLLVDVPPGDQAQVAGILARQLGDEGGEVAACAERLRQLNAVTALYIRMFQILGGLGLLLGGLGVAAVIARNGIERRGELALLRAAGFSRRDGVVLLAAEQVWLMGMGIAVGVAAAAAAVWPVMTAGRVAAWGVWVVPGCGILAVAVGGILASVATAAWVTHGEPWEALRQE